MNTELSEVEKKAILKRFMQEFFPFTPLRKAGFFTSEMRGNYEAQAARVCARLGLKNIYEYGAKEIRCHLSKPGERSPDDPFITVIPSIYD